MPLRCIDTMLKENWGSPGLGAREALLSRYLSRGCWRRRHVTARMCVCARACKIRSRENFCFFFLQLWLLGLWLGRPGACAREGFRWLTPPGRGQPARPCPSFLNPGSARLGRATQATSPFSAVSASCAFSFRSFIRSTSHSFQTSSRLAFICLHHPSTFPSLPHPRFSCQMSVIWDSSQPGINKDRGSGAGKGRHSGTSMLHCNSTANKWAFSGRGYCVPSVFRIHNRCLFYPIRSKVISSRESRLQSLYQKQLLSPAL